MPAAAGLSAERGLPSKMKVAALDLGLAYTNTLGWLARMALLGSWHVLICV